MGIAVTGWFLPGQSKGALAPLSYANIAFGMGRLGLRPALAGAVGTEYRRWLEQHGVDLVMIAQGDARAMLAHAAECRALGYAFAVDPSPVLGQISPAQLQSLVDGASYVFTNSENAVALLDAAGWSTQELLVRVGTWVVTRGSSGVVLHTAGAVPVTVPAVPGRGVVDRDGVADAFRAGFLSGLGWRLSPERSAQVGCLLASTALETQGAKYSLEPDLFVLRFGEVYGSRAAAEVEIHLESIFAAEDHHIRGYN